MNFLEMFITVMAVILFATTAIVHHQAMATAADQVTNASHTVQSMQLAQEVLDEIDARLFAPQSTNLKYSQIITQYGSTQREYDLAHYGAQFHLDINAEPCDRFGSTTAQYKPNTLVTVLVTGPAGQRHPVSLSRVYVPFSVEGL